MSDINTKLREFDKIVAQMRKILKEKNNDYGNDNIGALGERGLYVRIWDKVSRLKELVWLNKTKKVKDESIEDTLVDLANYSIINIIYRRNKW